MATPSEFADACRQTSKSLRRLPADVRRALAQRVRDEVAQPIAADVRAGAQSVYAHRVAPTTRVRAQGDPTIVVGGSRRVASGGARGRDLVFGANFGGGSRVTAVPSRAGRAGYRRRSTRQFAGARDPFVFRTVGRNLDRYLDLWAGVVDAVVGQSLPGADYERRTRG